MKKLISKITQTILIIAFIYCLLSDQWKIAAMLGLANMIFWLVTERYKSISRIKQEDLKEEDMPMI